MHDAMNQLEKMVDAYGLEMVSSLLEDICYAKAEHLSQNWQDDESAKSWEEVGAALGKASKIAELCSPVSR